MGQGLTDSSTRQKMANLIFHTSDRDRTRPENRDDYVQSPDDMRGQLHLYYAIPCTRVLGTGCKRIWNKIRLCGFPDEVGCKQRQPITDNICINDRSQLKYIV